MAVLSVNGLDHMNTASDFFIGRATADDFTSFSGTVNYLPTGGVNGGGALEITNGAYINGGPTGSSGAGGWFKLPAGFSETYIARKWNGNNNSLDFGIRINANGSIDIIGAAAGYTRSVTPAGFIEAETYYYFCFWHARSDSGRVTLRINNTPLSVTNDDFVHGTTARLRYFEGGSVVVDDIVITTTDETDLPPQLIYNLTPSADSTPQDFSFTGAASAWEALDDIKGDGDTSYISSGTPGHISKFDLSDLPVGVTSVTAVQPYVTASRDGAGANVSASFAVKTAAAATVSTGLIALSTGLYSIYSPTGAVNTAYTPADVNGMTIEFEVVA